MSIQYSIKNADTQPVNVDNPSNGVLMITTDHKFRKYSKSTRWPDYGIQRLGSICSLPRLHGKVIVLYIWVDEQILCHKEDGADQRKVHVISKVLYTIVNLYCTGYYMSWLF